MSSTVTLNSSRTISVFLMERFTTDPRLRFSRRRPRRALPNDDDDEIPRHHVHGALKCYSRQCFEAIGGSRNGSAGTRSTRPMPACAASLRSASGPGIDPSPSWGSADGAIRGLTRLGECAYIAHYPPLGPTAFRRLGLARPRCIKGLAYVLRLCPGRVSSQGTMKTGRIAVSRDASFVAGSPACSSAIALDSSPRVGRQLAWRITRSPLIGDLGADGLQTCPPTAAAQTPLRALDPEVGSVKRHSRRRWLASSGS